jgi:hypothetical protein
VDQGRREGDADRKGKFYRGLLDDACAWLEWSHRLDKPIGGDEKGVPRTSRRRILESAARQSGKTPAGLNPPGPFPEALLALREVFDELCYTRQHGDAGLQSITHAEIKAWQKNRRTRLTPFEITALLAFDATLIKVTLDDGSGEYSEDHC